MIAVFFLLYRDIIRIMIGIIIGILYIYTYLVNM